jgi:NAD(P)H-flavin reductase
MSVLPTSVAPSRPLEPMLPRPVVIENIQPEAYGIATFSLRFQQPDPDYRFQPGQFNMLYLPGYGEVAISISSDPATPEMLGHTIRYAGNVTRALGRLKPGDTLGLRGPFGTGWPVERARERDLVIVAGGIGLAPLRPLIYAAIRNRTQYGRVMLLYGARTPAELLYTGEFDGWREKDIEVHVTVDRADENWTGLVGVVPQLFYRVRLDHRRTLVVSCGPEIMMRFVVYEALARRIPKEAIYLSMERNMKCAVGFCGHCQFGPHFICKQGPVLRYSTVEPFFGKEDF